MARRKKCKFDTEKKKEELNQIKNIYSNMMNDLEKELCNKSPKNSDTIHNIVSDFNDAIMIEVESEMLKYNSDTSPIVSERDLVMEIFDIKEGDREYESLDSYEREHRRIKELLKYDEIVKVMLDRGIHEKDKEEYVRFIKKIINNPKYKKYLAKAKKIREGEVIKIPEEMLDDLLDLLDSMAESQEEKNLLNLRKEYIHELKKIAESYRLIIEKMNYFSYYDLAERLTILKSYTLAFEEMNDKLVKDLTTIERRASERKSVSIKLAELLYKE